MVGSCIAMVHEDAVAREVLGLPQETGLFLVLSFDDLAEEWQPAKMGGVVRWKTG